MGMVTKRKKSAQEMRRLILSSARGRAIFAQGIKDLTFHNDPFNPPPKVPVFETNRELAEKLALDTIPSAPSAKHWERDRKLLVKRVMRLLKAKDHERHETKRGYINQLGRLESRIVELTQATSVKSA